MIGGVRLRRLDPLDAVLVTAVLVTADGSLGAADGAAAPETDGSLARLLAALDGQRGAVAAVLTGPVTDTLKVVGPDGLLRGTADRDRHRQLLPLAVVRGSALGAALATAPAQLPGRWAEPLPVLLERVAGEGAVLGVPG
jgi:hypothetical protein